MFKYPVYKPFLAGNEKKYVNECLNSSWISSKGEFIGRFEKTFADFTKIKYAATVSNGTVALHTALLALGIKEGDEVIVPTLTYIASVNAIKYTGATPIFVDSEDKYWQMCAEDIKNRITPKTKAIMVVHLYGHPCNMDEITKLAKNNNLLIIEDCAEALGTLYRSQHVGSFGDVACYSFFGNKTVTTGEGGMITTNNKDIYEKCLRIKGQGLAENREYWHDIVGYNYRMTNIQAAIGLAQLENIDDIILKKIEISKWYKENLIDIPIECGIEAEYAKHTHWMVSILVNSSERADLRSVLRQNSIETRPFFYPIHQMPMYNAGEKYEIAENIAYRGINLPSYPELSENNVGFICEKIRDFYVK